MMTSKNGSEKVVRNNEYFVSTVQIFTKIRQEVLEDKIR